MGLCGRTWGEAASTIVRTLVPLPRVQFRRSRARKWDQSFASSLMIVKNDGVICFVKYLFNVSHGLSPLSSKSTLLPIRMFWKLISNSFRLSAIKFSEESSYTIPRTDAFQKSSQSVYIAHSLLVIWWSRCTPRFSTSCLLSKNKSDICLTCPYVCNICKGNSSRRWTFGVNWNADTYKLVFTFQ